MAVQASLEILIKTFVEGLKDVEGLNTTMDATKASAEGVGQAGETAGASIKDLIEGIKGSAAELSELSNAMGALEKATAAVAKALGVGEEDKDGLGAALQDVDGNAVKAGQELSVTGQAINQLGEQAKKAAPPVDDVAKQLTKVYNAARNAAVAILAYLGVQGAGQIAKEAAEDERLALALEVVGRNAGYAEAQLRGYSQSLQDLGFASGAADKALTKLISTGINLSAVSEQGVSTAVRLGTLAKDLAVTTGQAEAAALDSLTAAIARGNERAFKQMGLRFDLKKAEEDYAKSIGVTVAELTKADKAQAALNGVLQAGAKFAGLNAEALKTTSGQLKLLATEQERLTSALGTAMQPAFVAILGSLNQMVVSFRDVFNELEKTLGLSTVFGDIFRQIGEVGVAVFKQLLVTIKDVAPAAVFVAQQLGEILKVMGVLTFGMVGLGNEFGLFKLLALGVATILYTITTLAKVVGAALLQVGEVIVGTFGRILNFFARAIGTTSELGNAAIKMSEDWKTAGDKMMDSIQPSFEALVKLASGTEEVKTAVAGIGDPKTLTAFESLKQSIQGTAEEFRKHRLTVGEAAEAYALYRARLKELEAAHEVTDADVRELDATLDELTSNIKDEYSVAMGLLKLDPGELSQGYSQEGEIIGRALAKMASDATKTGTEINNAFRLKTDGATSVQALGEIFKALTNDVTLTRLSAEELQEQLDRVGRKFYESFDTSLAAAKTVEDVERINTAMLELAKVMGFTDEQLSLFGEKIMARVTELKTSLKDPELVDGFKTLGTTVNEALTGTTDGATKAARAIEQLGISGKVTGKVLDDALGKGLNTAKTLNDLTTFNKALLDVAASGKISTADLASGFEQVRVKVDELYQSQLKAADTAGEFDKLKTALKKLGDEGTITQEKLALMLEEVTEKQTGFREAMKRTAQQAVETAQATTASLSAQLDVSRQAAKIQQDQTELVKLEKAAREDNTAATRAGVEAQKALIAADKATLEVKKQQAQVELATMDLIAAKQAEINAKDAADRDKGNIALQIAAAEAAKITEQKEIALATTKVLLETEKQQAEALAFAAEEAKRLADNLAAAAEGVDKSIKKYGESINAMGFSADMIRDTIVGIAGDTDAARRAAASLNEQWQSFQVTMANKSGLQSVFQMLEAQAKLSDEIRRQAEELRRSAEEAARWKQAMDSIFDSAEKTATAITDGVSETKKAYTGTVEWADAMEAVANRAFQAAKSAKDATLGFLSSVQSIRIELLRAQGKEVEATKLEFEAKRKQLAIEERLLEIKIRAAIIQAKAAGLDDAAKELEGFLGQVKDGYQQALKDIDALEEIQIKAAIAAEKAAKEAEEAKRLESQKTHDQKMTNYDEEEARRSGTSGAAFSPSSFAGSATSADDVSQSIASGLQVAGGTTSGQPVTGNTTTAGATAGPNSLIKVDFTFKGKSVPGFVEKSQQEDFLTLIEEAKKSAA